MKKRINIRWQLAIYDLFILVVVDLLLLVLSGKALTPQGVAAQFAIACFCTFGVRLLGNIYGQIWRYGGIQCYIRLILTDAVAYCEIIARCKKAQKHSPKDNGSIF